MAGVIGNAGHHHWQRTTAATGSTGPTSLCDVPPGFLARRTLASKPPSSAPSATPTGHSSSARRHAYAGPLAKMGNGYADRYLKPPNYTRNLERLGFGPADFAGAGSDRLISQLIPNGPWRCVN